MNLLLPAKNASASKCISDPGPLHVDRSRFDRRPLVTSCNFRSVKAGTNETPS
jgi:hypothetical protein